VVDLFAGSGVLALGALAAAFGSFIEEVDLNNLLPLLPTKDFSISLTFLFFRSMYAERVTWRRGENQYTAPAVHVRWLVDDHAS
jgi:hypothetical protein